MSDEDSAQKVILLYHGVIHDCTDIYVYGTIIRTGIACMKISCYMHDSACRSFIVKKDKIFCSYVQQF